MRIEDWGLRIDEGLRMMIRIRIEEQGLRMEEVLRMGLRSRTFVAIFFGQKSHTFEDISDPSKCPRVDILSFLPALIIFGAHNVGCNFLVLIMSLRDLYPPCSYYYLGPVKYHSHNDQTTELQQK